MENFKEIIQDAILQIDPVYLHRNERDFSYELYRQLRKLAWPKNVEVTPENPKRALFNINAQKFDNKLFRKWFFGNAIDFNTKVYRYPDLAIHEYKTTKQQIAVIEIKKRFVQSQVTKDLAKLAVCCHGRLNFKVGIFIFLGNNNRILEIPQLKEFIIKYPKVEIWTLDHNILTKINRDYFIEFNN